MNYNLELGIIKEGYKYKRQTGCGILKEDNWDILLDILDEKGVLTLPKEVKERENDDELHIDNL